jgi:hypothetical protein
MAAGNRCTTMAINLDVYYRGLAAEQLQQLADQLLELAREAEQSDAHDAARHLADVSTQLLDIGIALGGQHTPREPDESGPEGGGSSTAPG